MSASAKPQAPASPAEGAAAAPAGETRESIVKTRLDWATKGRKLLRRWEAHFTLARTIILAEQRALGAPDPSIAAEWGLTKNALASPYVSPNMGAFLTRIGVTFQLKELTPEDQQLRGIHISHLPLFYMNGVLVDDVDAFVQTLKDYTSTSEVEAESSASKNGIVMGWINKAQSLNELKASFDQYHTEERNARRLDSTAAAHLAKVLKAPSEELRKELERILAL